MKVALHRDYRCAPEGHTTLTFRAGDIIEGTAARMALEDEAGFEMNEPDLETKDEPVAEEVTTRRRRRRKTA